jgi:hypothetical protein
VSLRRQISEAGSLSRWGARAQVIVGTTRHEFVHRWSAPRSTGARLLVVPVFVVAAAFLVLVGLLLLAALLVVGLAVAAALLAVSFWRGHR